MNLIERTLPSEALERLASDYAKQYDLEHLRREFSVIVTRDDLSHGAKTDVRWHISVAGKDGKVPAWETLAAVAHEVRPGVPFVIGVPPKSWWINVHPGCLHLYETHDESLVDQWRYERQGHTPS